MCKAKCLYIDFTSFTNKSKTEAAYKLAIKTEGYECNELAIEGIKNARGGAELMRKQNAASSAYRSIMLKVNETFKKALSSGYKTQNFGALCDAGQSKLHSLKKSNHWIYISKASQKKVESLSDRLKRLKADYAQKNLTYRAEIKYRKIYVQAVKLYRDGRLLDSKSQQAYDKCTEAAKTVRVFEKSSHYHYVNKQEKQRFSVLREKVAKYIKTLVPPFPNDLKRVQNPKYVTWLSATSGSPSSEKERYSNETQHHVTLTKAFYCGKYEVTQEQWQRVMGDNPSHFKKAGATAPVDSVSWNDCQKFLDKLCALEGFLAVPTVC